MTGIYSGTQLCGHICLRLICFFHRR
uniref:Uncharacterized protein n=1 Tax=Arundo donax TaxID=35708 RepID=A0A0A9SNV9_ARUDO